MSLSLGLESLGVVNTQTVSVTDLLEAELSSLEAQHESEKALFDAATTMRNVHNFNEVINSLQKHSSVECVAFASELLGFNADKDTKKAEVKPSVGQRVVATLKKWWEQFKAFVRKCANWVRAQVTKLQAKIASYTLNATPSVNFTAGQLDAIASACSIGLFENAKTASKKFNTLYESIKDKKKVTIDLRKEGADHLRRAQEAQDALVKLTSQTKELDSKDVIEAVVAFQKVGPKVQKKILKDIAIIGKNLARAAKVDAGKAQTAEK